MKKQFLSLTLSALVMFGALAGCSNNQPTPKKLGQKKIGVSIFSFENKFQSYIVDAMKAYGASLQDVDITYADAKNNADRQLAQVQNFITQGVDAIIVSPVDTDASKPLADKCKAANIPIIAVNMALSTEADTSCYVGSDDKQAATIQMEALADLVGKKGNIAILDGKLGDAPQRLRTDGVKEVISKYPDMKVIAEATGDWDRAKAMAVMESWITSGKQIDVVAANNDEMAIGASKAIEAAGLLGKIKIGGIDATVYGLEYLKAGKIDVTVYQDARGQGENAIKAAIKLVSGEKVDKQIIIPFERVLQKDADTYMAKWSNLQ